MKVKLIMHNSDDQRDFTSDYKDTRKFLELDKVYDAIAEVHNWHTIYWINNHPFNSVCFEEVKESQSCSDASPYSISKNSSKSEQDIGGENVKGNSIPAPQSLPKSFEEQFPSIKYISVAHGINSVNELIISTVDDFGENLNKKQAVFNKDTILKELGF
jgi:hypothetical protein